MQQQTFAYYQPIPAPQPYKIAAYNSLSAAWVTLKTADTLDAPVLAALAYLEFVFNGAVKFAIRDLHRYLPQLHRRAASENVLEALGTIRAHMDRHGSFFYPLDEAVSESQLIREALNALQAALDSSLDQDAQTAKIRETLRFLVWKTGNRWTYVNFWNALAFKGGNGLWQSGQVALAEIRREFGVLSAQAS